MQRTNHPLLRAGATKRRADMKLHDAINLLGTLDNASGQICQMRDGKPVLILFDLGCSNCSEVASRNADELGEALATVVNTASELVAACRAMATAETPQDALRAAVELRLLMARAPQGEESQK